ncbi:MAG: TonB-dependent siderophore receptor [Pseudomonadota bacterium]|nr:TonB-dependent siderophore receptor [Pseudomonadota bacterium]
MNHSKNITNIGAALGVLLAAPLARSEEPVILPEITVTGSTATDTGYRTDTATTATKTDTPIFDLPVSIQVVPRELMDDRQVILLQDALETVSGVVPFATGGSVFDTPRIRGFEAFRNVYRDGFRGRFFGNYIQSTAHLERVEVLKGPASVLYGRMEPGGLINQVSKQPLATPYYSLQQQFGSFDLYRTTLDAAGPLTEDQSLLYRVNFEYLDSGSFRDFVGAETVFVAPVLTWNLSDRTHITLNLQYQHSDRRRDTGLVAIGDPPRIAPIPFSRYLGEPFDNDDVDDLQAFFLLTHDLNPDWTANLRFSTQQFDAHYLAVAGTGTLLPDNRSVERTFFEEIDDIQNYNTVLDIIGHFRTGGVKHTLLLGADYYLDEFDGPFVFTSFDPIDIFTPVYGAPRLSVPLTPFTQSTEYYGVYFQDQIDLLDNLHLLGGGRYDWATTESQSDTNPTDRIEDEAFSPRVGLVYQPLPWLALYGSYVESFGGANSARSRTGEAFEPETGQQYEAGLKTEWLEGTLSATLAFYHLTKQNILTPDPVDPNNFSVQTGEARSQGIELDLAGQITPGWSIIASYAYTDTEITQDTGGREGFRLHDVPEYSGSLWMRYRFLGGPWKGLSLGAGVFAASERTDSDNSFEVPGYARVDLSAAYTWKLGPTWLTARLNVENLLDKEYFKNVVSSSEIHPGAPRTFLGSLQIEY